jgi:hypothetical protein
MANRLEGRLAKLEGANRSAFLKIIIRRFAHGDKADCRPVWHPAGLADAIRQLRDELPRFQK